MCSIHRPRVLVSFGTAQKACEWGCLPLSELNHEHSQRPTPGDHGAPSSGGGSAVIRSEVAWPTTGSSRRYPGKFVPPLIQPCPRPRKTLLVLGECESLNNTFPRTRRAP